VRASAQSFEASRAAVQEALRTGASRACDILTSDARMNEWIRRSSADLRMMTSSLPTGPYPYAGIPWYSTAFGRDGMITAMQVLWIDPELARGVLEFLSSTQARRSDPGKDAEPGKILHETRSGEMAALGEIPFDRYYGSVDSTPLFILLAGAYYHRTGDLDLIRRLRPSLDLALRWIERHGDLDGDGFVEYSRMSAKGLLQQGWKDSGDSVFHGDGRPAEPPIALCEVQGYVYAAYRAAAALEAALRYAQQRTTFGKPISQHQAIQLRLADMATRIHAARSLLHTTAAAKDRGESVTEYAAMCKLLATETAMWVTTQAIQVFGGYGYTTDYPVERLFRDAKVTEIYEGTSEIQKMVIARSLLRDC